MSALGLGCVKTILPYARTHDWFKRTAARA